jgi:hypothetical protein
VRARLGDTLIRIGRPPKRMLLYRTDIPFPKMSVRKVEALGEGCQLVAFGVHPDTGQPYQWPQGNPLELPLAWLPPVDREGCARLLRDVAALLPAEGSTRTPVLPRHAGRDERGGTSAEWSVRTGARNDTLWQHCMEQARHCDDLGALLDVARTRNAGFVPPLGEDEVIKTACSAWGYTDRGDNWFGRGRRVVTTHEEIDGLLRQHPDAPAPPPLGPWVRGGERDGRADARRRLATETARPGTAASRRHRRHRRNRPREAAQAGDLQIPDWSKMTPDLEWAPGGGRISGCGFDRRPGVLLLELGGAAVSERRVQAPVVVLFDEARELLRDVVEGLEIHRVDALDLEGLDQALGHRVVVRIATARHGAFEAAAASRSR